MTFIDCTFLLKECLIDRPSLVVVLVSRHIRGCVYTLNSIALANKPKQFKK